MDVHNKKSLLRFSLFLAIFLAGIISVPAGFGCGAEKEGREPLEPLGGYVATSNSYNLVRSSFGTNWAWKSSTAQWNLYRVTATFGDYKNQQPTESSTYTIYHFVDNSVLVER